MFIPDTLNPVPGNQAAVKIIADTASEKATTIGAEKAEVGFDSFSPSPSLAPSLFCSRSLSRSRSLSMALFLSS